MRAYVGATIPELTAFWQTRIVDTSSAVSVTAEIRSEDPDADEEEHEYAAFVVAVDASAAALLDDPAAPRRRVVLAVDIPSGVSTCSWDAVAAVHADEADVDPADAQLDTDLLWFAPFETATLLNSTSQEA